MVPSTRLLGSFRAAFVGYNAAMSIDRILISLGVLLLIVSAVLAAITWL